MNWTENKSMILTKICLYLFMVAAIIILVFTPEVTDALIRVPKARAVTNYFIITIRICVVVAFILLYRLHKLVHNIGSGNVFSKVNINLIREISWLCFLEMTIFAVSAIYYIDWIVIAAIAGFIGLIVRVIKNVLCQAFLLKEESDYTI